MSPGAADKASGYLRRFERELLEAARLGPVLDLACGDGRNGLYLAGKGAEALLVDRADSALASLGGLDLAENVRFLGMDLETPEAPAGPLFSPQAYGVVLVFRYLHRPLVPALRSCLAPGGMLVYETFLTGQEVHGRPRHPEHLLRRGELLSWFGDWEVLDHFEGDLNDPPRVMGRIACRRPVLDARP